MAGLSLSCPSCGAPNVVEVDGSSSTFVCAACNAESPIDDAAKVQSEVAPDYLVGELISDCKIVEKVGEGGFGSVYKAMDQNLQRAVAFKVMLQSLTSNVEFVQKFIREAVTAAQLNHPNIVAIHKVGREESRGLHYLIMEFVDGITLSDLIAQKGVLSVEESLPIMLQACDALATAHEHNIVHRDIKPENLMLDQSQTLKITDFGLAKSLSGDSKTTKVMGTPHYMSPEQFEGKPVDGRSDIYSLGVTFYYLLSKARPYEGQNTVQIIYSILTQEPKALPEINPDVPPLLWSLISKMIAKKAENRYQSLRETIEDLRQFQRQMGGDRSACPECGAKNPKGRKFCRGCGAALLARCPSCGNDEPARATECSNCGADVARLLKVKKLIQAGNRFQSLGDLRRAADSYRGALDLDPENADARGELEKLGVAIEEVDRVRSETDVLLKTGDIQAALGKVEELLQRHPAAVEVREQRDQLKQQLGARKVNALVDQAETAASSGDIRQALALLDNALRVDPDRADVRARRAELGRRVAAITESRQKAVEALAAGRFEDAFAMASEVLQLTPGDTAMEDVRRKAQASVESVDSLVSQGHEMLARRDWGDALSRFESALALRPGDAQLLQLVGDTRKRISDHRERMAACRRQMAEREFDQARAGLQAILAENPEDAEAHSLLQSCEKSMREFQRLGEIEDTLGEARRLAESGDLPGALQQLNRVLELDPRNEEALSQRRDLERRARQEHDIRELADEHLQDGRYEEGIQALERLKVVNEVRAADIDAEIAEARRRAEQVEQDVQRAEQAARARDYRAARAAADAVLAVAPRHPRAAAIRKDCSKAIAAIDRFLGEADRLILSEMFDEAMEALDKARERGASGDEFNERKAACEQGRLALLKTDATRSLVSNDYDAAIAAYEQVLEVAGSDGDALKGKRVAERRVRIATTEPLLLRLGTAAIVVLLLGLVRMTAVASTDALVADITLLENAELKNHEVISQEIGKVKADFTAADAAEAAGDFGGAIAAYDAELGEFPSDVKLTKGRAYNAKMVEATSETDPARRLNALLAASQLVDFAGAEPERQRTRKLAIAALSGETVERWFADAQSLESEDPERARAMYVAMENHPASKDSAEAAKVRSFLDKLEYFESASRFLNGTPPNYAEAALTLRDLIEVTGDEPERQARAQRQLDDLRGAWVGAIATAAVEAANDEQRYYETVIADLQLLTKTFAGQREQVLADFLKVLEESRGR